MLKQKVFNELKDYLSSPKILSRLVDEENLYIYLAASNQAVSVILVKEEKKIQRLIFYVSKVLKAEVRYPNIEKVTLVLLLVV